jgi:hypothetical protein
VNGRSTVPNSLLLEAVTGSADTTPAGIAAEAKEAALPAATPLPTRSVAGVATRAAPHARDNGVGTQMLRVPTIRLKT